MIIVFAFYGGVGDVVGDLSGGKTHFLLVCWGEEELFFL